jgi:hypothetical protein
MAHSKGRFGQEITKEPCKQPCNSSQSMYDLKCLDCSKFWKALQFSLKNGLFEKAQSFFEINGSQITSG